MGKSTFRRSRIIMGKDGAGKDILAHGITPGAYMLWDASEDKLKFAGGADMDFGSFGTPLVINQDNNYLLGLFGEVSVANAEGTNVERGLWSRVKVSAAQTGAFSITGGHLQFRWADGATTLGSGAEVPNYSGAWLHLEQDTAGQALADYAHASGAIVQVETFGALTIPTNAHLSGIQIESRLGAANGQAISLNSGTIAGLFITKSPAASGVTAQDWPYGIFIEDCTVAMRIAEDEKIEFRDDGIYIQSNDDGKLKISADGDGADDITLSGSLTLDDYITAACTSPGNGRFTMQQNTLTIGGDHTGQSVTALRLYTVTSDGTARAVGNLYGARIECTTNNAGDTVSGLMAGLQIIVDLEACTFTGGGLINGLDMVFQQTETRAKAPNAFIALNDHDHDGSYPVAYLFDLGGLNSEISDDSGGIYYHDTLKLRTHMDTRYIPLSTEQGTYTTAYLIESSLADDAAAVDDAAVIIAGGVGIGKKLYVGSDIVATKSTGADVNVNGIFENLTVTGDCTGTVCGMRSRVQTDGTARTISMLYGGNFDARLVHVNDALSGMMAGLQVAVSLGECTTGSLWVYGINIDLSVAGGTRATDIKAFIDFQDYDYDGTYRCATLFDIGGSASRCSTGTEGDLHFNDTLHILVNTTDKYIPLSSVEGSFTYDYLIRPHAAGGAVATNALLMGVGTSLDPATTTDGDKKFYETYCQVTATSGMTRGEYLALEFKPTGGTGTNTGEAIRGRTVVNGTVGSVTGVSGGVEFNNSTPGAITGSATGITGTMMINVAGQSAGGLYGISACMHFEGAGGPPTTHALLELRAAGNATGIDKCLNAIRFTGGSGEGLMSYNDTIRVLDNTTAKYLFLSTAQGALTTSRVITTTGSLVVGATGGSAGSDATFYGTTDGAYMLWDEAKDYLVFAGAGRLEVGLKDTPITLDSFTGMDDIHAAMIAGDIAEAMTNGEVARNLWSRARVSAAQATNVSIYGACLQLRVNTKTAALEISDGLYAGAWLYYEASDAEKVFTLSGGEHMAAAATVELSSLQDVSTGSIYGIKINSAVHGDVEVGSLTSFSALYINAGTGKEPWTTGIKMADGHVVTGIEIGTVSGYAINFTGDEGRILMGTDTDTRASFAAAGDIVQFFTRCNADSGICTGLDFEHAVGTTGATSLQATAIRGVLRVLSGASAESNQIYEGAAGYFLNEGTLDSVGLRVTGIRGCILDGGEAYTNVDILSAVWADTQLDQAVTGDYQLFLGTNNGDTVLDQMISLYGDADYFLKTAGKEQADGWYHPTDDKATTSRGWLKVNISGDVRYIALYVGA